MYEISGLVSSYSTVVIDSYEHKPKPISIKRPLYPSNYASEFFYRRLTRFEDALKISAYVLLHDIFATTS